MARSQLDARTFGIGELITQRKLFAVPPHQRSYAWGAEQVEQFLDDIQRAIQDGAQDYFIGLVVLQGSSTGTWEILDGQQRLATTTMIYSGIRNWLSERNLDPDANQIEGEYIGVRQLGGKFSPRLRMNVDNREDFDTYIVRKVPFDQVRQRQRGLRRASSNAKLLEGTSICRSWVDSYSKTFGDAGTADQARVLFNLALFLEGGVKVVCVDVASDADAFTLFEVLNDRGTDLSAIDLVKNHIFGKIEDSEQDSFESKWRALILTVDARSGDDFLKVFWTSRYGVVQKNAVYRLIKSVYPDADGVRTLIDDFLDAALKLRAIDDPNDILWAKYAPEIRDYLTQINLIGSRQVRPVILSALHRFDPAELPDFMWMLVVMLVRYQLIGQGRTGILEKELGRLAEGIWKGEIATAERAWSSVGQIVPDDSQFTANFISHVENKPSRVRYLLTALNEQIQKGKQAPLTRPMVIESLAQDAVVVPAIGKPDSFSEYTVLEQVLIERNTIVAESSLSLAFEQSIFPLTQLVGEIMLEAEQVQPHETPFKDKYLAFAASWVSWTWRV